MHAGGAAGEAAVDISAEISRAAAPAIRSAGRSAYQAADMAASAYLMHKIRPAAMQVRADGAQHFTDMADEPSAGNVLNGTGYQENSAASDVGTDQIAMDAGSAICRVVTPQGSPKNSVALRAMQQATMQLEKEIAVMKEEGAVAVTQELIRKKRIETQTAALSAEILKQMEKKQGYEKGSQAYAEAESLIQKKISEMLEEKNKPLV